MVYRRVTIKELSTLIGYTPRQIRTLMAKRAIPFEKAGYRTLRFVPEKVEEALGRHERKPRQLSQSTRRAA